MMREATDRQREKLFFRRYLYPVVMAIIFLTGTLAAARLGIMLADQQVPPGSTGSIDRIKAGSRWEIGPAMVLTVSEHIDGLREYAFRSSGAGHFTVEGVSLFEVDQAGVELEILAGGDRRYLKVQVNDGENHGKIFWLMARELREMGRAKRP